MVWHGTIWLYKLFLILKNDLSDVKVTYTAGWDHSHHSVVDNGNILSVVILLFSVFAHCQKMTQLKVGIQKTRCFVCIYWPVTIIERGKIRIVKLHNFTNQWYTTNNPWQRGHVWTLYSLGHNPSPITNHPLVWNTLKLIIPSFTIQNTLVRG